MSQAPGGSGRHRRFARPPDAEHRVNHAVAAVGLVQDIALRETKKVLPMFEEVGVPIPCIAENMAACCDPAGSPADPAFAADESKYRAAERVVGSCRCRQAQDGTFMHFAAESRVRSQIPCGTRDHGDTPWA
jgi:Mrp family chromosome partitioning ATPase